MNVVIAAGGTGGHLYPAIAVAREFMRQDEETHIVFVGTSRGIESTVLAHEGFELDLISAKPLMGKHVLDRARAVAALPRSLWQSLRLLKRRQADLVIGVGGYTSPTVLLAAFLRRIPIDPMTNSTEWGLRSYQDKPDSTSWGGQNVFDVYTKAPGTALDGTKYREW